MATSSDGAVRRLARQAYNRTLRPHLPRKFGVYAGVTVRWPVLLDLTDRLPEFKSGLVGAIGETVEDGDRVTLVGGGRGVSAVHCVRAGAGRVDAYEAAAEMLEIARETTEIEGCAGSVAFHHALVGEAVDVFGEFAEAAWLDPADLDAGDVLVLDCEGAERSILAGLEARPRAVVVETHPEQGVPTAEIRDLLERAGYAVDSREYEPDRDLKRVLVGRDA